MKWRPSAALENIKARANMLNTIRRFFAERNVMEVETPLMCHTSVTDPFIQSIPALFQPHPKEEERYYLQTSPEYAMKRLLAAGSGCIFQINKAFRQGERGPFHNPEFTIMEWYRVGFDHHQLMDETDELLQLVLKTQPAERLTYQALFENKLQINPHQATITELMNCAAEKQIEIASAITDKVTWLDLLMTHHIEPALGITRPLFVYDFPVSQAALARIQPGDPPVAARFEVYVEGMELANGFFELKEADEQRKRFQQNNKKREQLGLPTLPIDEYLLAALHDGLPDCAGVALGIDRLLMLVTQSECIADVLSFDFTRA